MIIVKLISGLGNQLFQYALARNISLQRNTSLKLDTSFFEAQNLRSYKLDKYNIKADIATEEDVKKFTGKYVNHSVYNRIQRKMEQVLPKEKRRVYNEQEWWVYEPYLQQVSSNVYLNGYWQHYKYFVHLHPAVLSELELKPEYLALCQSKLLEIRNCDNSVAVHVRRGDYISDKEANQLMGVLPLQYYHDAIALMKKRLTNPRFYFFSDDIDWVEENMPVENGFYIKGNSEWLDLELIRNCKHAIIANSSFSWWGAFLNQNKKKIIIAPKHWVVKPEINKKIELLFPEWITL